MRGARKILSLAEYRIAKKMLKRKMVPAQREMAALIESFTDDGEDTAESHALYVAVNKAMANKPASSAASMHYHLTKFRKNH
mmetsp:Transcript_25885/g.81043  ORF Transcript_25885/g.81043 Transcript_25885/m.81043 type:complete len:82 (-) Transcript_25885:320-565(-)